MANITNINIDGISYGVGQESTGGDFYVPDRAQPPTADTLSYIGEDEKVHMFSIGQMCRYYSEELRRHVFYQFQGNVDGKAEWRKMKDYNSSSIYAQIRVSLKTNREEDINTLGEVWITVTNVDTMQESTSVWYDGYPPVDFILDANKTYSISVSDVYGYITPEKKVVYAASFLDSDIEFTYRYMERSYIDILTGNSKPAAIYGDINKGVIAELLSEFKRCFAKKTAEGEVTICYLHELDSGYYYNGINAVTVGQTYGIDTMVYFPEYYYKITKNVYIENSIRIYISKYKVDDEYIHSPACLVGAYKATMSNNKIYSVLAQSILYNTNKTTFKTYASNRGAGYQIIDYYQHCTIALFLYAKYGRRDLRNILGIKTDKITQTGWSRSFGNGDSSTLDLSIVNSYGSLSMGIENIYDAGYEIMDGITFSRVNYNNTFSITNLDGSIREVISYNTHSAGGYIRNIKAEEGGSFFDVLPTNTGGGSETFYTDYFTYSTFDTAILLRAGILSNKSGALYLEAQLDNRASYNTTRLAFRGIIKVEEDVETFNALPII